MALSRVQGGSAGTLTPAQSIYEASATSKHRVGERMAMGDGRVFYYGHASTTIAAGQIVASDQSDGGPTPAGVDGTCVAITAANRRLGDTSKAITAALAVGDTGIGVTHASYLDGIVDHQLKDGFIFLNDTGGVEQYYKIKDNKAVADVTADVVEILLYDEIAAATVDATCSVVIMQNPFYNLALAVAGSDECVVGVPAIALSTTTPYGWIQTWGECSIKTVTDTAHAGSSICVSATAGSGDAPADDLVVIIGHGLADVATAGDGCAGYLRLRP